MSRYRTSLAGQAFDVLVVGGGINGVAIARECARAHKSVLLAEQYDFAAGTTSRSTRIIHGGLRYLEHGEIGLVRESLRERKQLVTETPHLVRPLEFLLAVPGDKRSLRRSSMAIRTGLWLYRHWSGNHWKVRDELREFERRLDSGHTWSIYSFEDAQCEFPERLTAEWLTEALGLGAAVRNHTRVLKIIRQNGKVKGARLRDAISGEEYDIGAGKVVNATGPWADFLLESSAIQTPQMVGGVRGSHLVLPSFPAAPRQAVYSEAADGRQIFLVPWNGQTLVGTTEVSDQGRPENARPTAAETAYLWEGFRRIFPQSGLGMNDIRYSFAGVRPLPYSPGKKLSAITRRHILHDHGADGAAGLISVIGGKLTTAASLAREVSRKLGFHVREPHARLAIAADDGVESSLHQWAHLVASKARIPEPCAHAIAEWHGRRALAIAHAAAQDTALRAPLCTHCHHIVAEAVEAVEYESAVTLADILLRRVPVALGACWSEACSRESAEKIGLVLGWDWTRIGQEFERFEEERRQFLHPRPEPQTAQEEWKSADLTARQES